jgi:hypothetical protein
METTPSTSATMPPDLSPDDLRTHVAAPCFTAAP